MSGIADIPDFNYSGSNSGINVSQYDPNNPPVVPSDDLSSIFGYSGFMPSPADYAPSALGGAMVADPSGSTAVSGAPTSNPNNTGGWMTVAQTFLNDATKAFTTYSSGSPSAAIPPAKRPGATKGASSPSGGLAGVNWMVVGGAIVVGVVALAVLAHYA